VIFQGRRKTGQLDLEALEMAVRSAMHQAGAAALTQLLQFAEPSAEQRAIPCSCGQRAQYRELRSKAILTAVGPAQVARPYYLCAHCHTGQFPADIELDIENTEVSPGVRRMEALVGQDAPFDRGRQQMRLLADLTVTAKAVERNAEAIGEDIAARQQREIQRAVQLDLPRVIGKPLPILYIEMDGTGVPVVKKETAGRLGKTEGQPAHTREGKLGCRLREVKLRAGSRKTVMKRGGTEDPELMQIHYTGRGARPAKHFTPGLSSRSRRGIKRRTSSKLANRDCR
jgi:hypothetical protein